MTMLTTPPGRAQMTFEGFFAESWPWAFRLASFLVQDTAAGEDIAQDSFMAMSQRWGKIDEPRAYLRTSVVNGARTWNRRAGRHRITLPLLMGPGESDLGANEMADAIARLPFRQRAVVVLRYYHSLSETEIADALGCRPGTVKSLSSRALGALSKEIER